jgi:hypothetical protein
MSAALKSYVPRPTPDRLRQARNSSAAQQPEGAFRATSVNPVEPKPQANVVQPVPLTSQPTRAIQLLANLQILSGVLAASLVGLSLVSYGASVYIDRQLNQATRRLNQLQRSEQQLITANEMLKSHMAQQAGSPSGGLTPPTPQHVIFLRPAHQRHQLTPSDVGKSILPLPQVHQPMGY